ncbi:MAG: aldehyde dehydrogenase family protein, partial [Longimicrobiales bacterium]
RYGLAASVWTENINLALDVAPKLKAGTVWINSTNVFDAASGFGGYRESGFGREGGKEGLYEYVKPAWQSSVRLRKHAAAVQSQSGHSTRNGGTRAGATPPIDRTAKLYIGGRQVRPDSGYSLPVHDRAGRVIAEVGQGNRKDVRNAVEAAHTSAWPKQTAHNRAQVLFYLAENMAARTDELAHRLRSFTRRDADAAREVQLSVERLFLHAAHADKWEGRVHQTPYRMVTLAMREPVGVLGIICPDERPLLGFISAIAPALALGNAVIAVPSETAPLLATDFYQIADTSDVPAGALNIITGRRSDLVGHIAAHDDVEGVWYFPVDEAGGDVERLAAANMKRTWIAGPRDWTDAVQGAGDEFLRHATEFKNIWVPYGE